MKEIIVSSIHKKEFKNSKSIGLTNLIFDDLIILLKFMHRSQKEGLLRDPFFFTSQIDDLDQCWHQFILHTVEYHKFCIQEFGEYLHHIPSSDLPETTKSGKKEWAEAFSEQFKIVEKYLGQDFTNRVYFLYPEILKQDYANES
jgi:hypothetical protein